MRPTKPPLVDPKAHSMPSETNTAVLLQEGIQAARSGQAAHARALLLKVIEQDERNETAWLWLSGVVDTAEDRLVCLENVLAINPANLHAQKGLAKLQASQVTAEPASPGGMEDTAQGNSAVSEDNIVRVERPPISPAAAVLYPERQIMELPWDERTDLQVIPAITYESHSAYDDVWEKENDICAFCAYEVAYDETVCPQCKRKLTTSYFQYPQHSADLIVYFVLLIGTSQLFFIHALVDLIIQAPLPTVIWDIFLFLVLFVLSGAIVMRQFWAYTASIIIMILIFLSMIFNVVTNPDSNGLPVAADGVAYFEAMAANPYLTLFAPVLEFLVPFQMLAIFLALIYGIFKAGPDFVREQTKLLARVDKGINDASTFYAVGKAYAEKEMWASAVLHFQRAAAHEPNRAFFHLATGQAFAQLGFKQRAMDAYTSAQRLVSNDKLKAEINLAIADVNSK